MEVKAFNNLCPQHKAFPAPLPPPHYNLSCEEQPPPYFCQRLVFQRRPWELFSKAADFSTKGCASEFGTIVKKKRLDSLPPCFHFNFIFSLLPLFSALLINSQPAAIWVKVGSKREERAKTEEEMKWHKVHEPRARRSSARVFCLFGAVSPRFTTFCFKPGRATSNRLDLSSLWPYRAQIGLKGIVHS